MRIASALEVWDRWRAEEFQAPESVVAVARDLEVGVVRVLVVEAPVDHQGSLAEHRASYWLTAYHS